MKKLIVVFLALTLVAVGTAGAQDTGKMLKELKSLIQKNSAEIQGLKAQLKAKDQIIASQEAKLKSLEGKTAQMDTIDQRIETIIREEKIVPAKEPRGEFGLLFGGQSGVYRHGADYLMGGFYDPVILAKDPLFGQRLSGHIMATFSRSDRQYELTPSLSTVGAAFGIPVGSGNNPFAQRQGVNVDVETLSVILGTKYRIESLGKVKPYMAGGLGLYVFGMDLDNDYVMGQVPSVPELDSRGYPAGNADLEWGVNFGGGVEYQITDLIAVGFDGRYNWTTGNKKTDFGTYCGFVSFNF